MMIDALLTLTEASADQYGLVTTSQADRIGIPRMTLSRLTSRGALHRIEQGVYAVGEPIDMHQRLRAAWLASDPSKFAAERLTEPVPAVIVSFASATALFDIGDLRVDVHVFSVPTRKQVSRRGVNYRTSSVAKDQWTIQHGLPVTTVERTIVDLLTSNRHGVDLDHVARVAADALDRRLTATDRLASTLDLIASRFGTSSGSQLLDDVLATIGRDRVSHMLGAVEGIHGRILAQAIAFSLPNMHRLDQVKAVPSGGDMFPSPVDPDGRLTEAARVLAASDGFKAFLQLIALPTHAESA